MDFFSTLQPPSKPIDSFFMMKIQNPCQEFSQFSVFFQFSCSRHNNEAQRWSSSGTPDRINNCLIVIAYVTPRSKLTCEGRANVDSTCASSTLLSISELTFFSAVLFHRWIDEITEKYCCLFPVFQLFFFRLLFSIFHSRGRRITRENFFYWKNNTTTDYKFHRHLDVVTSHSFPFPSEERLISNNNKKFSLLSINVHMSSLFHWIFVLQKKTRKSSSRRSLVHSLWPSLNFFCAIFNTHTNLNLHLTPTHVHN